MGEYHCDMRDKVAAGAKVLLCAATAGYVYTYVPHPWLFSTLAVMWWTVIG